MLHNSREYDFIARDISRRSDMNFPPRSCDLTLLSGYTKGRVYADKSSTLKYLKTNIRQVMAEYTG